MGATSALKLRQVAENLELILSLELLCAAQGIDLRRKATSSKELGAGTREIYRRIRERVPFVDRDQYLKDYIDSVTDIVREFEVDEARRNGNRI